MEGALLALFELPLGVLDASGSNLFAKCDGILLVVHGEDEVTRAGFVSGHDFCVKMITFLHTVWVILSIQTVCKFK